jgi:hypothetical protein
LSQSRTTPLIVASFVQWQGTIQDSAREKPCLLYSKIDDHIISMYFRGVVACSPLLQHNFLPGCSKLSLSVHSSPFSSGPLPVPTARTLSIARVASPFSIDKTYQALFLRALKEHFEGTRRLVKKGDMIAVGIDTDATRRPQDTESTSDDFSEYDEVDLYDYKLVVLVVHGVFH